MAKVEDAQEILKSLGMPPAQHNHMAGATFVALCGLTPDMSWSEASRAARTVTKGVMDYLKEHYGTEYAPNTRETFRRQVLHQFVQGRIADYNPFQPNLPTNSPRAHYAVTLSALKAARLFGTSQWSAAVAEFRRTQGSLTETYDRERLHNLVPIQLPDGRVFKLSPGKHNEVQKAIIEAFAPRFAPGSNLLYLGDTANKNLFVDEEGLESLGISITEHDKLPDVVLHDHSRNWLFLVEAVTSHGPMTPKRIFELAEMLTGCDAGLVHVSAFPDFSEFRKHMKAIAWETEVWLADAPDHMIHFNGDRFLGPRDR